MVPTPGCLEDEARYLQDLQVIQLIRKRDLKICSAAVVVEDSGAISQAVQHLSNHGHRRIAYIGGETSLSSGHSRLSAFMSGMHKAGLDPTPDAIITDTPSFAMGHRSARWLIKSSTVSAIICGGFEISNGALNGCLEEGIHLPEDIAFVGYGDPSYYRWINGGISTIRIPVDSLAEKTAGLLDNKPPTEAEMFKQLMLPAEFVTRQSSGPYGQGD
jgi:LacI family transcriptional regulator